MPRKGFFLLAFLCALIAAGSAYIYLRSVNKNAALELKPLVVAKTKIPARSVIQADQLTVKNVPVQGYPQGGASSVQSVEGAVALVNLTPGDAILNPMIERISASKDQTQSSPPTTLGNAAAVSVPPGKRAVAVPIGLVSGVGYAVKPGDHVDVLVTMDIKDANGTGSQTVTSLAAQDVLVLSVGESIGGDKNKPDAKSYTLALSVPQAMAVTLGSEKGSLRLLLRNPANTEVRQDSPVNPSVFLDPGYFNIYK